VIDNAEFTRAILQSIEESPTFLFFNSALNECYFLLNRNQKMERHLFMIARFNPRSQDSQHLQVGPEQKT
jgi:hypothetical protein